MIEKLEQLATKPPFVQLFKPLVPKSARDAVLKSSGLTGQERDRLKSFVSDPKRTIESREEKLFEIPKTVGLTKIEALDKKVTVDLETCKRLIKVRHTLAHDGIMIDEYLLYNVLFPCRTKRWFA